MNRFLVGLVCLAVVGCLPVEDSNSSPSGSSGLNVQLSTPTFEITAENGVALATVGLESMEYMGSGLGGRSLSNQNPLLRLSATETEACDNGTGSATVAISTNGINDQTGEMSVSGSFVVDSSFDNCDVTSLTVFNGQLNIDTAWTGYDSATSEFGSMLLTVDFLNFSATTTDETTSIDGQLEVGTVGSATSMDWALSVSSSATNSQILTSETTTSISGNQANDYPSGGAWIIKGASGTSIVSTIEANGLEISINGAQATLVVWDDLEAF